ncbi:hypothetical protein BS50DRAFT_363245 [Corynespora cassiicola Philippines]|uniref:Uncharacterized protein n=1 Tax=Corynespora cassiicola Philippines TaxID=1448308 RepID=A0A2T2NSK1_CORCC|nr:hypothetical protein BS50DRAFT_363245 [Corynespora cassiicola Philippines]
MPCRLSVHVGLCDPSNTALPNPSAHPSPSPSQWLHRVESQHSDSWTPLDKIGVSGPDHPRATFFPPPSLLPPRHAPTRATHVTLIERIRCLSASAGMLARSVGGDSSRALQLHESRASPFTTSSNFRVLPTGLELLPCEPHWPRQPPLGYYDVHRHTSQELGNFSNLQQDSFSSLFSSLSSPKLRSHFPSRLSEIVRRQGPR